MSGHSKWAQIKRQKGAADIKRGQTFTKLSNSITLAVKQGRGVTDPGENFRLRIAIEKAHSYNMPKENIQRSIERAAGRGEEAIDEVVYEGFGPKGVSIIVEAVTDNRQRTTADVKNIFEKNGGNLGQPGTVSYQFKQMGQIVAKKNNKSFDELFSIAVDSGAEDIEELAGSEDRVVIYTNPSDLAKVKDMLSQNGLEIVEYELTKKPITEIAIDKEEDLQKTKDFVDKLEELDDVQKVYTNLRIRE